MTHDGRRVRAGALGVRALVAARTPLADEAGDQGDHEDLADEHLHDRERLAHGAGRDEIPVARGREGGVAEEDVVAGGCVGLAGEERRVGPVAEEYLEEREQQAEQGEDADRPEDRPEVDVADAGDDAPQDREGGEAEQDRDGGERQAEQVL